LGVPEVTMSKEDISSNSLGLELILRKAVKNNHNFEYSNSTIDSWIRKYELSSDCINELIKIIETENHCS
jgi:hypothetical protein